MKRLFLTFFLILIALPAQAGLLDIQEITSPGGIKAWLVEDHNVPVISMEFTFKNAGSKQDPADKQGLARMVSNTLDEGAGNLDSQSFQKQLRDMAITLGYSASRDDLSGSLKTITANRSKAFELLRLSLTAPRFDEEPVARMRQAKQARIRSSLSDPEWIAARLLNDVAFAGDPYAQNSGGTISSLARITPEDLRTFAAANLARDNLVVAVAGDITAKELGKKLDEIFGDLPAASAVAEIPPATLQNQGSVITYQKDIPQSIIEILQPGIGRDDPDYHNAQVMNFILGASGFGSRLMEEIREKRGLTYGIYTYMQDFDQIKTLGISTSTENKNAGEMLSLIQAEWHKMLDAPVTQEELESAQNYLIGSLPLSMTSTDKIAGLLLGLQREGLSTTYLDERAAAISAARIEDIRRVAQRFLDTDSFVTVIVGKPENITAATNMDIIPNAE